MNNKDFIGRLSAEMTDVSIAETQKNVDRLIKSIMRILMDENTLSIQNFGTFEVKKRMERIVVNPATKQKMLVPPKMVLGFKPSPSLKDKIK